MENTTALNLSKALDNMKQRSPLTAEITFPTEVYHETAIANPMISKTTLD
jgi:hypothetical protein